MAQTKRKRRRKHRGTQAGTVEARGRTGRPATGGGKATSTAKQMREDRRQQRLDTPPTWRGVMNRSALSALVFGLLAVLLLKVPPASAVALAAVMFLLYWPLSYYSDRFFYNRRQRQKAAR